VKSLILQILLLLVLFSVSFVLLRKANLIKFPGFIEDMFYKEEPIVNEYTGDGTEILEYIGDATDIKELSTYPEITVENMNKLLNSLDTYENFYWECTSQTFAGNTSITRKCESRISGNKYNISIFDETGAKVKSFISNGERTVVSKFPLYGESGSSVYHQGIFDFYSDAGLVSVEYFKDIDFSDKQCEIRLINEDKFNLLSVIYSYNRNGIEVKNNYRISLDYGVVLFAECIENGITVYKQTTTSINPQTFNSKSMFAVN